MSDEMFDLDVQVATKRSKVEPQITSVAFCTPGCEKQTTLTSCCFTC